MTNEFVNALAIFVFSQLCEEQDTIENKETADSIIARISEKIYSNALKSNDLKKFIETNNNQDIIDMIVLNIMSENEEGVLKINKICSFFVSPEEVSKIVQDVVVMT